MSMQKRFPCARRLRRYTTTTKGRSVSAITVTIRQAGQTPKHQDTESGTTLRSVLSAAGFNTENNYSVVDEDGNTLSYDDQLDHSTSLVIGGKVAGAV